MSVKTPFSQTQTGLCVLDRTQNAADSLVFEVEPGNAGGDFPRAGAQGSALIGTDAEKVFMGNHAVDGARFAVVGAVFARHEVSDLGIGARQGGLAAIGLLNERDHRLGLQRKGTAHPEQFATEAVVLADGQRPGWGEEWRAIEGAGSCLAARSHHAWTVLANVDFRDRSEIDRVAGELL